MTIRDLFGLIATSIATTVATVIAITILGPFPTLGLVSCFAAYQIFRAFR